MQIVELIKSFCNENSDKYRVYENYSGKYMFGKTCLGVVIKKDYSYMDFLAKLTAYLQEHDYDDADFYLEGIAVDELGLDTIVYFPRIESK